jgi:hypothetical protein
METMARNEGLLIPPRWNEPLTRLAIDLGDGLRRLLGGPEQAFVIPGAPAMVAYANAAAATEGTLPNPRASQLISGGGNPSSAIAGPVVLCGNDPDGQPARCPKLSHHTLLALRRLPEADLVERSERCIEFSWELGTEPWTHGDRRRLLVLTCEYIAAGERNVYRARLAAQTNEAAGGWHRWISASRLCADLEGPFSESLLASFAAKAKLLLGLGHAIGDQRVASLLAWRAPDTLRLLTAQAVVNWTDGAGACRAPGQEGRK